VVKDDVTPAVRWTFYIGLDGKVLYIDKAVSPGTHGQAVVNKLAELGVSRRRAR
jgi:peroxiredoxin Q/BCP